jgi:hypothetical protein
MQTASLALNASDDNGGYHLNVAARGPVHIQTTSFASIASDGDVSDGDGGHFLMWLLPALQSFKRPFLLRTPLMATVCMISMWLLSAL